MPKTRAKLSEKQERILVQCQLMGLTTYDMVQISNRLIALDKERSFKERVAEVVVDKTWEKKDRGHYIIKYKNFSYECYLIGNNSQGFNYGVEAWKIKINRKRGKTKNLDRVAVHPYDNEKTSLCPDNDKRLFRLLNAISMGYFV
jgi:hypothetical protein